MLCFCQWSIPMKSMKDLRFGHNQDVRRSNPSPMFFRGDGADV